jgi:hypothetical protein
MNLKHKTIKGITNYFKKGGWERGVERKQG